MRRALDGQLFGRRTVHDLVATGAAQPELVTRIDGFAHAAPALLERLGLPVDASADADRDPGAGGDSQHKATAGRAQLTAVLGRLELVRAAPPAPVQPV